MASRVVHLYVEVAGDDKFMSCGCCGEEEISEFVQKLKKGSENVGDMRGR